MRCNAAARADERPAMSQTIPAMKLATKNDIKTNWSDNRATQFQDRLMSEMMTFSRGVHAVGNGTGFGAGAGA
jgi:hypothetical protein